MLRQIEVKVKNQWAEYKEVFTQDNEGRWENGDGFRILEEDVIDMVKKYDRSNLNKYFPMEGFHK